GPHAMPERGQHATDQLGDDHRGQRQGEDVALDDEQGRERVAAALQRGKAKTDRYPQHDAVPDMKGAQPKGYQDDEDALDELLDQPHLQRPQYANADQPVLEDGCGEDADDSADDEGRQDPARGERRARVVIEVPNHRRYRDHETPQHHDGGKQDHIVSQGGNPDRRDPEGQPDKENPPPGRDPALTLQGGRVDHVITSRFRPKR